MVTPTGILLLHGYGGHRNSNWLGWLRKELQARNIPVFAPDLPESSEPILADQLAEIAKFASKLGEHPIIVAHSLGAITAVHFVVAHSLRHVRLVLVAPVVPHTALRPSDWTPSDTYFVYQNTEIDENALNDAVSDVILFLSRTDPYIDFEPTLDYWAPFGERLTLREYPSAGHFNTPAGYREFPDLLPYLLPS
jgi:uncharacterized protein